MAAAKTYQYAYPRPSLAADCVIFGFDGDDLKLLLIERDQQPFKNQWSLPGGFVKPHENTDACAQRILLEKTGIKNIFIEQLYTFSEPHRDPREWVVSVAYYALVNARQFELIAGRGAVNVKWMSLAHCPKLAFDHNQIVKLALERLRAKITYQPVGFELLNKKFTLPQLQHLYETILGVALDKRNFRKKISGMNLLDAQDEFIQQAAGRPAQLYSFNHKAYKDYLRKGFHFEI